MTVGVKFCGQCNPQMDIQKLYRQLVEQAAPAGVALRPVGGGQGLDAVLVLGACGAACAQVPEVSVPVVRVTPSGVDGLGGSDDDLPAAVLARLREATSLQRGMRTDGTPQKEDCG